MNHEITPTPIPQQPEAVQPIELTGAEQAHPGLTQETALQEPLNGAVAQPEQTVSAVVGPEHPEFKSDDNKQALGQEASRQATPSGDVIQMLNETQNN